MADVPTKYRWITVGTLADYHSVIGGPVTQPGMEVRTEPFEGPRQGRGRGPWCTMLKGKAGWVACSALSPAASPRREEG